MDKLKDILSYVPGFRSDTTWKKIIAGLYYIIYFSMIFSDFFISLFGLALPFVIFYSLDWIRNRKKEGYSPINTNILIIASVVFFGSVALANTAADTDIAKESIPIEKAEKVEIEEDKPTPITKIEETPTVYKGQRDLKVHFIDVGQGDSIFLELPNGQNALIDGGPGANKHYLIKYLKSLNFDVIDYLVATHPHEDHIGGLPDVIRNWQIGKVYMPNKVHTTKIFEELITLISEKNYEVIKTQTDTILLDLPGLSLKAMAPDPNTAGSNLNDYSIVLRLDYNNNSFMFTGDAESQTEQYLLADNTDEELKVDVLKVGHHGSKTSSIPQFISKVNPSDAVITSQKGNSYGHPNEETITTLNNNDITIHRTDTDGTIIATSDGEKITWVKKGNPIEANAPPAKTQNTKQVENKPTSTSSNTNSNNNSGGNTSTKSTQTGQGEVFITKTGSKYHRGACGKGNYFATTLEDAKSRGLTPCKKCY